MVRTYTFLIAPIEAVGDFNACIGISQCLKQRGHRVVFATPNSFRGKLIPFGFDEEYFQDEVEDEANEKWGEIVASMAPAMAMPPFEKMQFLNYALYQEVIKKVKDSDHALRNLMKRVKPDVVVVDHVAHQPALMDSGVPWVMSTSLNPLGIYNAETLPPAFYGLSLNHSNNQEWSTHSKMEHELFGKLFEDFKTWLSQHGGPTLTFKILPYWQTMSPFANICISPLEISYDAHAPLPTNFQRFDAFMRTEEGEFEVPQKLQNGQGKLVYFSMGSIGCSELGLMRKLICFLANSPNRFIVSKGQLGDQLVLPDNMWGANHLPQTLVIPLVDLVITHGGNNTVTETFTLGKPILVLPLFCDQLDNGVLVEESGHGLTFQPYQVTQNELLTGIETLLGNELLKRRMVLISARIKASNCQALAADVIESVALSNTRVPETPEA